MSTADLYTVTMRRTMAIKTPQGTRSEDIVETFKNMTWKEARGLRETFANVVDITVEKTSSGGRKASKKPDYQVSIGGSVTKARDVEPKAATRRPGKPATAPTIVGQDLGSLVNVMAEKETV